ncbi:hypothetical protein KAR91_27240 [Candidatus Pacearchaeota archaeon]|nr:hypothetical protein [Candidatus Pacearchaeota archaeon]
MSVNRKGMMRCQFCDKREWQIKLIAEGAILKYVEKWLICMQCYRNLLRKPGKSVVG